MTAANPKGARPLFSFKTIVIVGLGLVGGSLAQACRKAFPRARIIGVTRSRTVLAKAKRKGWIHMGTGSLGDRFTRNLSPREPVPFVVLCTPVDTLKNFLLKLDRAAPPGTVVTDAGSVKGFLARWTDQQRWRRIQFVGAHPMAGSHERGIEHARLDLFENALTFVTPGGHRDTARRASAVRIVVDFWKKICRQVMLVSPETHDQITAEISHLPHFVASALVRGVRVRNLPYAASGFLDTTRVAQSDPNLWAPIFTQNRRELLEALQRFEAHLNALKKALREGDRMMLKRFLSDSQRRRARLQKGPGHF